PLVDQDQRRRHDREALDRVLDRRRDLDPEPRTLEGSADQPQLACIAHDEENPRRHLDQLGVDADRRDRDHRPTAYAAIRRFTSSRSSARSTGLVMKLSIPLPSSACRTSSERSPVSAITLIGRRTYLLRRSCSTSTPSYIGMWTSRITSW